MNNNLLTVLFSSIKARITPIWTKLKYWTSWNFIKTKIIAKIRNFLATLFDVKPRDQKDYYTVWHYLVSRRLVHAVVIVVGLLCLCYVTAVNPLFQAAQNAAGTRVYSYSSIPLRFHSGDVKIRAKGGYIAYVGAVDKGWASGYGRLYDKDGNMVYAGAFEKNMYSGNGKLYYASGQLEYNGNFEENEFSGSGTLYRESGSKWYAGEFAGGHMEGNGTLYDGSGKDVFTGEFRQDEVVYAQLLGKDTQQIGELYTGNSTIYQYDDQYALALEDIDAVCVAAQDADSLEDLPKAETIYVEKDSFSYGGKKLSTIAEIRQVLGEPVFEGNSYMTFPEAVEIRRLRERGKNISIDPGLSAEQDFSESYVVNGYDQDQLLYLYVFEKDDITYTFTASDRDGSFFVYSLE